MRSKTTQWRARPSCNWLQNGQRDLYHERHDQQVTIEKDGAAELPGAMLVHGAEHAAYNTYCWNRNRTGIGVIPSSRATPSR